MDADTKYQSQESNTNSPSRPKRWNAKRKSQIVLRLLRGEPIDSISREVGLQSYVLEEWRQQAVEGIEFSLKSRDHDPLANELDKAMRRIGELSMENELLKERCRKKGPLHVGRSKK